MLWLKNKKHRAGAALALALMVMIIMEALPSGNICAAPAEKGYSCDSPVLAWWGTLYPGFCFSGETEKGDKMKTSLWFVEFLCGLAKEKVWC